LPNCPAAGGPLPALCAAGQGGRARPRPVCQAAGGGRGRAGWFGEGVDLRKNVRSFERRAPRRRSSNVRSRSWREFSLSGLRQCENSPPTSQHGPRNWPRPSSAACRKNGDAGKLPRSGHSRRSSTLLDWKEGQPGPWASAVNSGVRNQLNATSTEPPTSDPLTFLSSGLHQRSCVDRVRDGSFRR
jgi:hypothetical protein